MSNPPPRCPFALPEDAKTLAGAQCIRDDGHDDERGHVVVDAIPQAMTFYAVDPGERVLRALYHADYRGNRKPWSEEGLRAAWAIIETVAGSAP